MTVSIQTDLMLPLSKILSRCETVTVVDIGPSDAFGYAGCMCSDGRERVLRNPVKGGYAATVTYPAQLSHMVNRDAITIQLHGCPAVEIDRSDLARLSIPAIVDIVRAKIALARKDSGDEKAGGEGELV